MRVILFYMYVFLFLKINEIGSDPVTYSIAAGIVSALGAFWTYKTYTEQCNNDWIHYDVDSLKRNLSTHLFGQHIVQQLVPAAILGQRYNPSKPLVMSFHGWPGGGKNYVSQFIVNNLFKQGEQSKFYHFFSGRTDFPLKSQAENYQVLLQERVRDAVISCDRSLFVFDEVDKIPAGVLDGIKPYLDHHTRIHNVDFRKAIFIFLSNTGGTIITERYMELWRQQGKAREEMTAADFENVLGRGAFNENGGLEKSDLIDHNLVDHYIPFLPLEVKHVKQCIEAELDRRHHRRSPEIIEEVMSSVMLGPYPEEIFSTSGCKRLGQKVSAIIQRKIFESYQK